MTDAWLDLRVACEWEGEWSGPGVSSRVRARAVVRTAPSYNGTRKRYLVETQTQDAMGDARWESASITGDEIPPWAVALLDALDRGGVRELTGGKVSLDSAKATHVMLRGGTGRRKPLDKDGGA